MAQITTAIGRRAALNQYDLMANDLITSTPCPGPHGKAIRRPGDHDVGAIDRTDRRDMSTVAAPGAAPGATQGTEL